MTDTTAKTTPAVRRSGAAIAASGVTVSLGGREVVCGVDLQVAPDSWTTIIGPNGAGKTTLLRAMAGLIEGGGSVTVDGRPVRDLSVAERARTIAVMPQTPVIPPRVAVVDYILLGRTAHLGHGLRPTAADLDLIVSTMAAVGLEGFGDRTVDSLSGGERQRVIIARALAQQTAVLLLDEPTTALDLGHQQDVLELIDELRTERGLTVLATLHDLGLAAQFSDQLALMVGGSMVAVGEVGEVLRQDVIERVYNAEVEIIGEGHDIAVVPRRRRRRS